MSTKLTTSDRLYLCLRQTGRAFAIYRAGGDVELIEFLKTDLTGATIRMECHVNRREDARFTATAAYVVEHLLFDSHQLIDPNGMPLSEAQFFIDSMRHAHQDKITFFGSDHSQPDGTWPKAMDEEFISYAIRMMEPKLQSNFHKIERLAAALAAQERVYRDEIERDLGFNPT